MAILAAAARPVDSGVDGLPVRPIDAASAGGGEHRGGWRSAAARSSSPAMPSEVSVSTMAGARYESPAVRDRVDQHRRAWRRTGAWSAPAPPSAGSGPGPRGAATCRGGARTSAILTVLTEELRAVVTVLPGAPELPGRAVAGRAADPPGRGGRPRAVSCASWRCRRWSPGAQSATWRTTGCATAFRPPIVLLVGVAGGIRADLAVGDVVIADEVIYYDARRETPSAARRRRPQTHSDHADAPPPDERLLPAVRHDDRGSGRGGQVRVFRGPIGTGGAVDHGRRAPT